MVSTILRLDSTAPLHHAGMVADGASGCGAQDSVVAGVMPGNAADRCT